MLEKNSTLNKEVIDMSLVPNTAEAEQFLNLLKISDTDNIFEFVTFTEGEAKTENDKVFHRQGSFIKYENTLCTENEQSRGVFVTVNCGSRQKDIYKARAIWQENDGPGIMPELAPSFSVESSPGKFHHYWLIEGGTEDLTNWDTIMSIMVSKYKSDKSAKDRGRVLRIPGFYHQKKEPFRCKLNLPNEVIRYEWSTLCEFFLKDIEKVKPEQEESQFDSHQAIHELFDGEDIHDNGVKLALRYANKGLTKEECIIFFQNAMEANRANVDPTRWKARYNEISKWVNSAFDKVAKERSFVPYTGEGGSHTNLPWPPGFMGKLARDVHRFMFFPNKEISIVTAHIVVAVFAGRKFSFCQTNTSALFRLHAMPGVGKATIRDYIEMLVEQLIRQGPQYLNVHKCLPPQRSFGLKAIIDSSIQSLAYVAIWNEGGKANQSKAGDQDTVQSFLLNETSARAYSPLKLPAYSKPLPVVYGVPIIKVVESVADSDALAVDRLISGEASREFRVIAHHHPDEETDIIDDIIHKFIPDPEVLAGIMKLWNKATLNEDFNHLISVGREQYVGPSIKPIMDEDRIIIHFADDTVKERVLANIRAEKERRKNTPLSRNEFTEDDTIEWARGNRRPQSLQKLALYQAIADACVSDKHVMTHEMLDYAEAILMSIYEGEDNNRSDYEALDKKIINLIYESSKRAILTARTGKISVDFSRNHKPEDIRNSIVYASFLRSGNKPFKVPLKAYTAETRIGGDPLAFMLQMGERDGYWQYFPKGVNGSKREHIKLNGI